MTHLPKKSQLHFMLREITTQLKTHVRGKLWKAITMNEQMELELVEITLEEGDLKLMYK